MTTATESAPQGASPLRPVRDAVGLANLLAVLAPGAAFAALLALGAGRPGLEWLHPLVLARAPFELWVVAVCGAVATLCGLLDWRYHRSGRRVVPRAEQRAECLALVGGGVPLFVAMCGASAATSPRPWLLAAVVFALFTAGAIVFDETRFHRRCSRYETLLHRGLVGGNGLAWLAWLSWCLERDLGVA